LQQHLKERLTGAAIIVFVVVLLVPEMFRGRPAVGSDSHAGPADGAPMRSVTIDLRDSPTTQPPAALAPSVPASDNPPKDAAGAVLAPPPATQVASAAGTPSAPLPEAVAEKGPPEHAPAVKAPGAKAPAGKAPTAKAPDGKVRYTVQVASFARRDFADRLVKQIRAKGFSVQTVGPDDRGLYRVRSAPTSERATATALKEKMQARGLKPIVSTLP
jgi:cell division septation protein DedD